jgi:hypothetical protein
MPEPSFQGTQLLSEEDLQRILKITDALQLHRDWVVVPIDTVPEGRELQQPDGKIILHAPVRERFEAWLAALRSRLMELDLGAVPRPTVRDPKLPLTGPFQAQARGTRNYLGSRGVLR